MSNVSQTSIWAYEALRDSGKLSLKQQTVLGCLFWNGPATRAAIAAQTGMPINAVCGRVHELMQAGHIENDVRITDPNTGMQVWLLKYKEVQDVQVS